MKKFFMLLFLLESLSGCDQSGEREITAIELQQQFQEIQNLIQSGECTTDSQCTFIAYGSKPCGGPQGYFVFSTDIDIEALKKKVNKYTEDERLFNLQKGNGSDCRFVSPPNEVGCLDGNCVEIAN